MHTNLRYSILQTNGATPQGSGAPPFPGYLFETPASIACVYGLVPHPRAGCNPNIVTKNPTGGGGAIAIVDAYDNPTALSDLETFSSQFGVPLNPNQFTVVYATGTNPGVDPTGGWEIEESLDVQWAHAMAPNAKIYLVEAASDYTDDLIAAVDVASQLVAAAGGGEVSMSWGGGEFPEELTYDSHFTTPGVVYFASSGDGPGTLWPSVSANVVAAGGTSLSRDPNTGNFLLENAWQDGGGGMSQYVARPSFQRGIRNLVGATRGTPDISFDANPATGVWVLDSPYWYFVGGTSVSSPSLAGITNAAGKFRSSSAAENTSNYNGGRCFRDITYGNCGVYMANFTGFGWDFCTGLGSPVGSN
jgi:subtilase family serine protease